MTKGLPRSMARGRDAGRQELVKKTIVFDSLAMIVDGSTGVGDGQVAFPVPGEGNFLFLGAVAYLQFSGPGEDLNADWVGDYSVGTTQDADDALTGTDVDIIASTPLAEATEEVSPVTRGVGAVSQIIDNTDATTMLWINLLVDDDDINEDGIPFKVDGRIEIAYIILGDD